jgi:uncharacterized protein involved in exopolysaccharide biosynthesis
MEKLLSTNLIKKYRLQILAIVGLFVATALIAGFAIKPRYKVASVISVSPSYFQNSLMREFLSETYDPNELRSQRLSVMSAALDKKFLDEIAVNDGIDITKETSKEAAERRAKILTSVEIIGTQATDFQIAVFGNDRDKAMALNQKIMDNILVVLKDRRMGMLTNLRSAVAAQIETMTPNIDIPATHDAQLVRITAIEAQIAELKDRFSDQHPQLVALKKQLVDYKKIATKSAGSNDALANYDIKQVESKTGQYNTVYEDLVRKLRYLNIVIGAESMPVPTYFSVVRSPEYPLSAIWPKKGLFVIWALLLGILTSLVYVAVMEIKTQQFLGKTADVRPKTMRDIDFIEETTATTEAKTTTNKNKEQTKKDDIRI